MNDMLYEIDGNMGKTLQVYEDRCVISSKASLKSAFFGHALDGNKEFYYKDLTTHISMRRTAWATDTAPLCRPKGTHYASLLVYQGP